MKQVALLLFITFTIGFLTSCGGVKVTVQNVSDKLLQDVELRTTSDVYELGSIPPGSSVSERIRPTEDTDLALSHRDHPERLMVGTYLTGGFTGQITIDLDDDVITKVADDIKVR